MAKKRKAAAPPPKPQAGEPQKPKLESKVEELEEEEEVEEELEKEEDEDPAVEEEEEEEEESDDEDDEGEDEEEEEESSSEEEDEESTREAVRKLLEPFGKEQIIDFLKEAALKDSSILAKISKAAESDPTSRKIFVYGLGWDATTDQVLAAFKPYGEIEECKVVTDKNTGRAKGYAFVLFKTVKSARKALKQPQKKIGNRMATCQLASAGGLANPGSEPSSGGVNSRKLFVGNVGPQVNSDKLRVFFSRYGEIVEGPIGLDPVTQKFKGYAIFVYKTAEACKKALEEPAKWFEGCQLQCRHGVEGRVASKGQTGELGAPAAAAATMQQSNVPAMNYGFGMNPGILGQGFNPAAFMMAQSQGIGLTSPLMGLSANGFAPSMGATPSIGVAGNYSLNSMSPSMIGSYNPQAALQGLGVYQSAQLGQSSAGATAVSATAARPQLGLGPAGTSTYPSFGR